MSIYTETPIPDTPVRVVVERAPEGLYVARLRAWDPYDEAWTSVLSAVGKCERTAALDLLCRLQDLGGGGE